MHKTIPKLFVAFLMLCTLLSAQTRKAQKTQAKKQPKTVTMDDAKIYRDAMIWFKKAEDMIGTPKENSDEQLQLFQKAIQIKPDFLEAHYNLGLIYANRNQPKEASDEFEQVLKIAPDFDEGIYFLMASAFQEQGNGSKAIAALEEGLRRKPDDAKMLKALAYLQMNSQKDDAAVKSMSRLLQLEPTDVVARIDLAQLQQRRNELEQAAVNYEDALRVEPDNLTAHSNLGMIYIRQKKYAEAAAQLEAANRLKPGTPEVLEMLGDAYSYQRQYGKAVAAYQASLEKASERAAIYAKLGFSLMNTNQPAEAVAALENAARLDPKNPSTFVLLGDLYTDLKRVEDAIRSYKRSLEINPDQKEVHNDLATLYAEQNRYQDAMSELKTTVRLDPEYAPGWANIAYVAQKMDLNREAIQAHEKLIALGKAKPLNYFQLGLLYAQEQQPDPSIAAFAKAIELEPEKYRAILREELKKVHSIIDSVRYKEEFRRLLNSTAP